MLKIILNGLKPQAEKIIAEKQASFTAERSTTEHIYNLRIFCEKYLQHQQNLYHVLIAFNMAFDRVLHAALWSIMQKHNISADPIRINKHLYKKATSAVLYSGNIGDWFRITVGFRQGCLLSLTLFNVFLERIMTDALEDHEGTVSTGCRTITNLHFADNIDGLAGDEEDLAKLVERLNKASTAYGTEISAEKTKLMTNNTSSTNTDIKVNGQRLETVTSSKYLGSVITDEGSKPEILSRTAQKNSSTDKVETSLDW